MDPPLILLCGYWGYLDNTAVWILGIFGLLVIVRIVLLPGRFKRRRARKREVAVMTNKHKKILQIFVSCNANTLNPTQLRKRISDSEGGEVLVHPAVYSILDRAISRDPAVFTIRG